MWRGSLADTGKDGRGIGLALAKEVKKKVGHFRLTYNMVKGHVIWVFACGPNNAELATPGAHQLIWGWTRVMGRNQ